ncbi:phytochrome interacting factor 3 [Striga asiatica]|uniref:Phytochrome interacting factor 3 n=1 Tax=Striga asiatica TaxID=4170 RepID=A0A5A7PT49_STRAF|nr:phytochrome interacting factor 3 [Striga asiatica]
MGGVGAVVKGGLQKLACKLRVTSSKPRGSNAHFFVVVDSLVLKSVQQRIQLQATAASFDLTPEIYWGPGLELGLIATPKMGLEPMFKNKKNPNLKHQHVILE